MKVCQAVDALLSAHLLGALAGSEAALVEEHLAGCPGCRAAQSETAECWEALDAPPCAPPPEAWQAIQARIGRGGGDDPVREEAGLEAVIHLACSFCRGGLTRAETLYCASCLAPHHGECFAEYGRCSVMGCGEQRVVRPSRALAPTPASDSPGRGPWPLILLALGGLSAAAAFSFSPPARLGSLERPPHHRSEPGEPIFQLDVHEATLGEVVASLAREGQGSVEVPPQSEHCLIRSASWRAQSRDEILRDLAERVGLRFEPAGAGVPARLVPTPASALGPLAPEERVVVDRTLLLGEGGQPELLWEGRGQRVAAAPSGLGLALSTGARLYLYYGLRQVGSAEGATLALAWSEQGRVLAALLDAPQGPRLVLFWPGSEEALQREVTGLELSREPGASAPSLAWVEDGIVVAQGGDLLKVSLGGQVHSFGAPPSAPGQRRLWGLSGQRFVLQSERALELWDAATSRRPIRCPAPAGFRLSLSRGAHPRALVAGQDEVSLLDLNAPEAGWSPIAILGPGGSRSVGISRSGAFAAWIDGCEGYVRDLTGGRSLRLSGGSAAAEEGLEGVCWGADERLVYWSSSAVYRIDATELHFETGLNRRPWPVFVDPGRVRRVEWSSGGLLITTERARERRARIRLARID